MAWVSQFEPKLESTFSLFSLGRLLGTQDNHNVTRSMMTMMVMTMATLVQKTMMFPPDAHTPSQQAAMNASETTLVVGALKKCGRPNRTVPSPGVRYV